MKNLTYDDWRLAGFQVRKGEKATGRDKAGKATYSRDQVEIANERRPREQDDAD